MNEIPQRGRGALIYITGIVAVLLVGVLVFLLGRSRHDAAARSRRRQIGRAHV